MVKDVLGDIERKNKIKNNTEGLSQYLFLINSTDTLFIPDLMIIEVINRSLSILGIFKYNVMLNEAIQLLRDNVDSKLFNIDIKNNQIAIEAKTEYDSLNVGTFFSLAKTTADTILKPIYKKYLTEVDVDMFTIDILLNKHIKSLLTSDSNFIIYDDELPFTKYTLESLIEDGHKPRLIKQSERNKFMLAQVKERETIFDYITNDVQDILVDLKEWFLNNKDFNDSIKSNFKFQTLIGTKSIFNINVLDRICKADIPCFSIGLLDIFKLKIQ